jgi:hypothetical protein
MTSHPAVEERLRPAPGWRQMKAGKERGHITVTSFIKQTNDQ